MNEYPVRAALGGLLNGECASCCEFLGVCQHGGEWALGVNSSCERDCRLCDYEERGSVGGGASLDGGIAQKPPYPFNLISLGNISVVLASHICRTRDYRGPCREFAGTLLCSGCYGDRPRAKFSPMI